jgi:hypothetical protein
MRPVPFERFAALCALAVSGGSLLYAALFITIVEGSAETNDLWFTTLLIGALFTIPPWIAIYGRVRAVDAGLALTGLVLGLGGAFGGVLHGGYELAANVTPPKQGYYPGPESVSKGVLRYLVAGLALLVIAWLIAYGRTLPAGLGFVAGFGGVLLVVIYFGRLFDFITPGDYTSLIPPILFGFVVHPFFYAWLGLVLWRAARRIERVAVPA